MLVAYQPIARLLVLVSPPAGRTAQDDQLQLFAALLIVNLLHVRARDHTKEDRAHIASCLQKAFDDATESQVRETIAIGLRRLKDMGSRRARLKEMARKSFSRAHRPRRRPAAHLAP